MNKDVLYTIYEIIHRDLTKQLNAEYLKKLRLSGSNNNTCTCNHICICFISLRCEPYSYAVYNYRQHIYRWMAIFTMYGKKIGIVHKNY